MPFFDTPTQIIFYDAEQERYIGGIGFLNVIICGCCGGAILVKQVIENTPAGYAAFVILLWVDIENDIRGDITGEEDAE